MSLFASQLMRMYRRMTKAMRRVLSWGGVSDLECKSCKSTYEEPHLLLGWLLLRHERAENANGVEQKQSCKSHSRIKLGSGKALQGVDNHQVSGSTVVDTRDTHERGNLAGTDTDSRTSHERCNGDQRNEFHNTPETSETDEKQDSAGNDGKGTGDIWSLQFGMMFLDLYYNISYDGGHDSDGSDGDVFGSRKGPVEDEPDETRVETVLSRKFGEESICHSLRNDDEADRDTGDDVSEKPCQIVVEDPVPEREETLNVALYRTSGGLEFGEILRRGGLVLHIWLLLVRLGQRGSHSYRFLRTRWMQRQRLAPLCGNQG